MTSRSLSQPTRGLCRCGHVMSMHCRVDGSGPCAVAGCPCAGEAASADDEPAVTGEERAGS